jgi:UDP-N-acetylmuramyl pentapeptide synthase
MQSSDYRLLRFTRNFLTANDIRPYDAEFVATSSGLTLLRSCWMVYMAAAGFAIWLVLAALKNVVPGGAAFAAALIIGAPLLLYFFLVLLVFTAKVLRFLRSPKKTGKDLLCRMLEAEVKRLRAKHSFTVVAVAGSIGKTSTKYAIGQLLAQNRRVRYQAGNYNDRSTVPLVFFGETQPSLYNIFAWAMILLRAWRQVSREYPYDAVVIELGSDGPGQIAQFAYTAPDIAVVTAVAEEHMVYFKNLDAVAREELGVLQFSKQTLINTDDTPANYLPGTGFVSYGVTDKKATYRVSNTQDKVLDGQSLAIILPGGTIHANTVLVGKPGRAAALAAVAVGDLIGLTSTELEQSMPAVLPYAGRMQILRGQNNATLIDDTYNAAPKSYKAALDTLYASKAPQRIAILGSINEMGELTEEMHREVGDYSDPAKLDLVVTVGESAKRWLAPAAKSKGCTVEEFLSPYAAGEFVRSHLKDGAVVLAKGSQNGVFAEEALKLLLRNAADSSKLVRQSTYWLNVKRRQFDDFKR